MADLVLQGTPARQYSDVRYARAKKGGRYALSSNSSTTASPGPHMNISSSTVRSFTGSFAFGAIK